MKRQEAIEDLYGVELEVGAIFKSAGAFVDIDFDPEPAIFVRLEPEKADELADRLKAAAKEARNEK